MAFLTQRARKTGKVWLISFRLEDQRQRSIYIGEAAKSDANDTLHHVEELLRARKLNRDPKDRTAEWVSKLVGSLRDSLVRHGLIQSEDAKTIDPELLKLKPFLQNASTIWSTPSPERLTTTARRETGS